MRNEETGKVSIQRFDDQEDIIEMAIYALSPEQTFEYLWGLSSAARQMRIESASASAKARSISRKDYAEMVADEAKSIREGQKNLLDPTMRLSEEEIISRAEQAVQRRLSGAAGAGQPAQPPAGAIEPPEFEVRA